MTQAQEIVTKPGSEISVVDLDINSEAISALALRCKDLPQDLSDPENYRMSQDVINEAREMRGKIKTAGKGLKEDAAKWQKKVVAEEKRLDGKIVDFLNPEADRKKAYDDKVKAEKERKRIAEQLRKDTHLANINTIRLLISEAQGKTSAEIEIVIEKLNTIEINATYEEFEKEGHDVWEDTDLALSRLLINAQTIEEEDRQRVIEANRLVSEKKKLDEERAENERIRLANEKVTRDNEAAAKKIHDDQAEAEENERIRLADEEAAKVETPVVEPKAESPAKTSTGHATSTIQKKIDEDNSVIGIARKNTLKALTNFLDDNTVVAIDVDSIAEALLTAIISHDIPNLRYDIY